MSRSTTPSLVQWILLTGLLAGTLDGLAAVINFTINGGKDPVVLIFRYIAGAVFGAKARTGGTPMVIWGIFFHYMIAMLFTIFFFLIYPKIRSFLPHPIITGLIYGALVWVIMNQVVVPLSNLPKKPVFHLKNAAIQMGILMLCIGLPISLMTKKYYLYKK